MDAEETFINGHHKTKFDNENENGEVSEDTDVEEAFINGEHRFKVDLENDYEKQRLIDIKVKERLSQLGLSPRTLKNKHRALARDLENKLISKCAAKHILERPPTTNRATSSNICAATNSRGGGASGKGSRGVGAGDKGSRGGGAGGKGSRGGGAGGKGSRGRGQTRLRK
jgi:hypothetical protein